MKLIIQIPCYNEAETLPLVVRDLPRDIPGIDEVEYLVIDDGSLDNTVEVARQLGVHRIIRLSPNRGLAAAFRAGVDACLERGADIVVNTDGDNQYDGRDIPKLVQPILQGEAEIVIGERPIATTSDFSPTKKLLQRLGSWFVRKLSGTQVRDAPSGFRAFTREALLQLNLTSDYTYTLESIIQAGRKRIPIANVKIRTHAKTRESRLMRSIPSYISYSLGTMLRVWLAYAAFRVFITAGAVFGLAGVGLGVRFLFYLFRGEGQGHVQSLILLAVLLFAGFQFVVIGLLADMISMNRRIIENANREARVARYAAGPVTRRPGR